MVLPIQEHALSNAPPPHSRGDRLFERMPDTFNHATESHEQTRYHDHMRTLLFILLATSLTACTAPHAESIAGSWTSTYDGTVMDLIVADADRGLFVVQPPRTLTPPFTGQFSMTSTNITLAEDDDGPCPALTGHYEFAVLSDVLLMTLKHDECTARATIMDYAWTRSLKTEGQDVPAP